MKSEIEKCRKCNEYYKVTESQLKGYCAYCAHMIMYGDDHYLKETTKQLNTKS